MELITLHYLCMHKTKVDPESPEREIMRQGILYESYLTLIDTQNKRCKQKEIRSFVL